MQKIAKIQRGQSAAKKKSKNCKKQGKAYDSMPMTPEEKNNALKPMLNELNTVGLKPDSPTQIFALQKKDAFVVNPNQLMALDAPKYDATKHNSPAKVTALLAEAKLARDSVSPLFLDSGAGPFGPDVKFTPSRDDLYQTHYSKSDGKLTAARVNGGGEAVFSVDDALGRYAGYRALTSSGGVLTFEKCFIYGGFEPTKLKHDQKMSEEQRSTFEDHRERLLNAMSKMKLIFPTAVDPCTDADGGVYAAGQLERCARSNVTPLKVCVPYTSENKKGSTTVADALTDPVGAPSLCCYASMLLDADEGAPAAPPDGQDMGQQQRGFHEDKQLHILQPQLVKKMIERIEQFGLVHMCPSIMKMAKFGRLTSVLQLDKWRKKAIEDDAVPQQLTDDGTFDPEWCASRLLKPFGFPYVEKLSSRVLDGVMQPELDEEGNVQLVPLTKNSADALNGQIWLDADAIANPEYKQHVVASLDKLMGRTKKVTQVSLKGSSGGLVAENAALKMQNAELKTKLASMSPSCLKVTLASLVDAS